MQRVDVSEVTLVVVSQLRAKLASMDRGQASEVIVDSCFLSVAAAVDRAEKGGARS